MFDRFTSLREEQLNIGIASLSGLTILTLFLFSLLIFTSAGDGIRAAILGQNASVEPTPTVETALLPPTWTPRATNTPTPTNTPEPTNTPTATNTPEPSNTPTEEATETPLVTETSEPDFAATIAAAQSATPPPSATPVPPLPAPVIPQPPPPPPAPTNPPVAPPPPPPPPPPSPTSPPSPTPEPTATPLPLYVLSDLLGGPNCNYVGISGTIRNADGSPRPGVTVEVFNEFGYLLAPVTDGNGVYEAFLDVQPRPELAGYWHLRVIEDGVQHSNEIIVQMSGSCTTGETQFIANFLRTR